MVQNSKNKKGVSLIITLFIMIIILAVVISISTLLYSEIKVLRNVGNSVVGLYAADSGIEKVLYYDRQYKPSNNVECVNNSDCLSPDFPSCDDTTKHCSAAVQRGLCSIFSNKFGIKNSCSANASGDSSISCNNSSIGAVTVGNITGCNPDTCDDCTVSFNTTLDNGSTAFDATNYSTTAKVYKDGTTGKFEIISKGDYSGASRQIQIVINTDESAPGPSPIPNIIPQRQPTITNFLIDCANSYKISANLYDDNGVSRVVATIIDRSDSNQPPGSTLELQSQGPQGNGDWSKPWTKLVENKLYWVYLTATDELGNTNDSDTISACCGNNCAP